MSPRDDSFWAAAMPAAAPSSTHMPSVSPSRIRADSSSASVTRTTSPSDSTTACSVCTVPVTPASERARLLTSPLGATQSLPPASADATAPPTSTATIRGIASIVPHSAMSRKPRQMPWMPSPSAAGTATRSGAVQRSCSAISKAIVR